MSAPDELFGIHDVVRRLKQAYAKSNGANLTDLEVESLVHAFDELKDWNDESDPETYRREPKNMPTEPVAGVMVDYAMAGTQIDKAMHHLDEGLPSGQRRRSETAFQLLRTNVFLLEKWMRARGYHV